MHPAKYTYTDNGLLIWATYVSNSNNNSSERSRKVYKDH